MSAVTRQPHTARRTWFAPEVVQTSAMDCGPASLKCVLDGHGLPVSYARLRDACHTDVDGTSIDTVEVVANQLGLPSEQILIPADHVLLAAADALPAIAVVRLSERLTHFVVLWRRVGSRVQVMDPASGRRWVRAVDLQRDLYTHRTTVPASEWRAWAGSDEFTRALHSRARGVGLRATDARHLTTAAALDPSWRGLAALDAVLRLARALVDSGGLRGGREAAALVHRLAGALRDCPDAFRLVPARFWSVTPVEPAVESQTDCASEQVVVSGAVVVRFRAHPADGETGADPHADPDGCAEANPAAEGASGLDHATASALPEARPQPFRQMAAMLRASGTTPLPVVAAALCVASLAMIVETLLFNGLLAAARELGLREQRLAAMALVITFVVAVTVVEGLVASWLLDAGRRLDAVLRLRFFSRVPLLGDRYFRSRLTSDIAERAHSVHRMRELPVLAGRVVRLVLQLLATTVAIAWLDPASALPALLLLTVVTLPALLVQPLISELDLRMRTHAGALSRYHLDALLGLTAVRAHGAERPLRYEHDRVLAEWGASAMQHLRASVTVDAVQSLLGYATAAWLVWAHVGRTSGATSLLIPYWALSVPMLGEELTTLLHQYAPTRNVMLRILEPLQAPLEDHDAAAAPDPGEAATDPTAWGGSTVRLPDTASDGVSIAMRGVTVRAAGREVLRDVTVTIAPGEHVAIVGRSGAGKSTLVGLLLGWQAPSSGRLLVDERPLDAAALGQLRAATAWVDPAVHVWNRPLLENLLYGVTPGARHALGFAVAASGLPALIEKLPDGLQTALGEGGLLVSGGEGQRVRLGRALARGPARLVVLDEPCRGLDRETRRALLVTAREHWKAATVLCVTHDIEETRDFDRVLVVEDGTVVEDGAPADLHARPSQYRALWTTERDVHHAIWSSPRWRQLDLDRGRLRERDPRLAPAAEDLLA